MLVAGAAAIAATLGVARIGDVRAEVPVAPAPIAAAPVPVVGIDAARALLPTAAARCADVPCLLAAAYARDPAAAALAAGLFADTGDVAGVGPHELMNGGYRGMITLVPQLPTGTYRAHLGWTAAALRSYDGFVADLFAGQPTQPAYRWRALELRFVRSIKKRTPSAYAIGWLVEYNVAGSLNTSAARVAETLWHEIFHTNDAAHSDWSMRVLATDYDAIVAKCGTRVKCLVPYAPNHTKVRGGTYYAFQPNNGDAVREYAAELAVRYWTEQRAMLATGALAAPAFKCGPVENARAWQAIVTEFFAGRDLTPPCAS